MIALLGRKRLARGARMRSGIIVRRCHRLRQTRMARSPRLVAQSRDGYLQAMRDAAIVVWEVNAG